MRRLIFPVLFAALAGIMTGCQKTNSSHFGSADPDLVRAARSYFEQRWRHAAPAAPDPNPRNSGAREPNWGSARVVQLPNGKAVVVPVRYDKPFYLGANFGGIRQYSVDDLIRLLIYKDSSKVFHAEMVTAMPDSNYKGGSGSGFAFSGMLLVDQWDGQPLARYKYGGQPVRVWRPKLLLVRPNPVRQADALILQTCYEIVGYNYPASNPSDGFAWQEDVGCTTSFVDETPGMALIDAGGYVAAMGGGGGGANFNPSAIYPGDGGIVDGAKLVFNFDSLPGIDLTKYFKCFTYIPDQGATYSVTLCADLPVDGNSGALLTTGLHPGHTFLILTKTNGILSLSQSFGFYPNSARLSITGSYVQSKIKDDGSISHEYDASITMPNISQLDFQTVENMATNLAGSQLYSLYNYNCTNFALQVYNSVRVNNPITVSDWIGNYTGINFGTTPNGLYETLVGMKTPFPNTSNPNITIGPKYAPASAGPCN